MRRVATAEQVLAHDPVDPASIHMPSPSWWPLLTTVGFPVIGYGMLYRAWPVAIIGGIGILAGFFGWSLEPSSAPHDDHHDDGDHDAPPASLGALTASSAH